MVWDLLDEDCAGIADWTDADGGTGVSEVSPAGQFRFDTNNSDGGAGGNYADRLRVLASCPDKFTLEIKTYFDAIGTLANNDHALLRFCTASWRFEVDFASDGLYILKTGGGRTEVGTNIVSIGSWQTWRFEVNKSSGEASAIVKVFLDDVLQGTVDCDYEVGSINKRIEYFQGGYQTNDRVSHIDYVKVATGIPENNALFFGCNF